MSNEMLLKCALLLFAAAIPTHAFWWAPPPTTTTTNSDCSSESPLTLKQIPLTYFRTYTYQPIPSHPFAAFPFYHHTASALPSPLLTGTTRFEHAAYMPAAAYPMNIALQPQQQQPHMYQLPPHTMLPVKPLPSPITATTSTTTTTKPPTTTRSTTTTTTTTTTPPPPTTTTTASSTTRATTSAPVSPPASDVPSLSNYGNTAAQPYPYPLPTFNRRTYLGYNPQYYRTGYPHPEYTVYKNSALTRFNSQDGPMKYVPCMCPMSVSSSGAGGESNAALLVQGRTADEEDDDVTELRRTADVKVSDELKQEVKQENEQKQDDVTKVKTAEESRLDGQDEAKSEIKQKMVATGAD